MNQQITTQDLFEIIGRQTVELELLRKQLEQLSAIVEQIQAKKEKVAQENGAQGIVAGVGEY